MVAEVEKSLSLPFADGITEGVAQDVVNGVVDLSQNTRLTVLKGVPTKAPAVVPLLDLGAPVVCGGVAPSGDDSSALFFKPGGAFPGPARWSGGQLEIIKAKDGSEVLNAWFPYPLTKAGPVPNGLSGTSTVWQPLTAIDGQGRTWVLSVRSDGGYITVIDERRTVVSTTWINNAPRAITAHNIPGVGDCVVLWDITGDAIKRRVAFVDNTGLVVGAQATIATYTHVQKPFDAVSLGTDGIAYIASRTDNNATVRRIDVGTAAITHTATLSSVFSIGNQARVALSVFSISGTRHLTAVTNDDVTFTCVRHFAADTLTLAWQRSNRMQEGRITVAPYVSSAGSFVVVATDSLAYNIPVITLGTNARKVLLEFYALSDGTSDPTLELFWHRIAHGAVYHKVSETEIRSYFPLMYDHGAPVLDPSVEIFSPMSTASLSPVMRCGVDRALTSPGVTQMQVSKGAFIRGDTLEVCYLARTDAGGEALEWPTRRARFDLAPARQPAIAIDERGVSFIASGLPAYWDGSEIAEHCPLHAPRVSVVTTGGGGANLTGTYSFTAVISWRDSTGLMRRSALATPVTVTLSGTKPIAYVAAPASMRDGLKQQRYSVTLFMTPIGQATFYSVGAVEPSSAITPVNGAWSFANISDPAVVGLGVRIYSTGDANEPLLPLGPVPCRAAAAVGNRAWIIDAEDPYRLLPSKPKERGIAFEFAPELEIFLPPAYGEAAAIADGGGAPLIFCERGIWTVGGYGPDASGQGSGFTDPQLVATRGCRNEETVIQVPGGGVLFQGDDGRMCLYAGGLQTFDTLDARELGRPVVFHRENEIAYPIAGGAGWLVYNWVVKAWTTSTTNLNGAAPTALAPVIDENGNTTALLFSASNGVLAKLDSSTPTTDPMVLRRGWVAPEDKQGDCVIREVWLQGLAAGSHGVRVRAAFDWNDANYIEREWSAAEIANLTLGGRYTIALDCHAKQARSVKLTVTELTPSGQGMRPVEATVYYGVSPGARRRGLRNGAKK